MRWAVGVGGLALVTAAALVVWGLTGPDAEPAAAGDGEVETATPQGLAAAVDTHLADDKMLTATDTSDGVDGNAGPELRVDLTYRVDGAPVDFSVGATEDLTEWDGVEQVCSKTSSPDTCTISRAGDGSRMAVLHIAEKSRKEPGFSLVVVHRGDQVVFATEAPKTPTELADLPVPVAGLEEIVTDPLVGLSTSPETNAQGESLPFGP